VRDEAAEWEGILTANTKYANDEGKRIGRKERKGHKGGKEFSATDGADFTDGERDFNHEINERHERGRKGRFQI
jgi:hypothetical protein